MPRAVAAYDMQKILARVSKFSANIDFNIFGKACSQISGLIYRQ